MNNFTVEDIKQSVDYQWHKGLAKLYLALVIILVTIILFLWLLYIGGENEEFSIFIIVMLSSFLAIVGVVFVILAIYSGAKLLDLAGGYKELKQYEIVLNKPRASYRYRGSIFYQVEIKDNDTTISLRTNACYSGMSGSKFNVDDYNNKRVVGLADPVCSKFYVVKVLDCE